MRPFPLLTMEEQIVYQAIGNIVVHNSYKDLVLRSNESVFAHVPTAPNADGTYKDYMFLPSFANDFAQDQYSKFLSAVSRDMKEFSAQEDTWVVEADIKSFYPSVDHNVLIGVMEKRVVSL